MLYYHLYNFSYCYGIGLTTPGGLSKILLQNPRRVSGRTPGDSPGEPPETLRESPQRLSGRTPGDSPGVLFLTSIAQFEKLELFNIIYM